MIKSKWETLEMQFTELSREVSDLKVNVQVLREKQSAQTKRHEGIKERLVEIGHRVHRLDDFMLSSLQRLSFIKTLVRFWPVLIVTLLVCFAVGIFVDDQKVAEEIRDRIELKA